MNRPSVCVTPGVARWVLCNVCFNLKHQTVCGWRQRRISRGLGNTIHLLLHIPVLERRPQKGVRWINFVHTTLEQLRCPLQCNSIYFSAVVYLFCWHNFRYKMTFAGDKRFGLVDSCHETWRGIQQYAETVSFRSRHHTCGFLLLTSVCGESVVMYCTQQVWAVSCDVLYTTQVWAISCDVLYTTQVWAISCDVLYTTQVWVISNSIIKLSKHTIMCLRTAIFCHAATCFNKASSSWRR